MKTSEKITTIAKALLLAQRNMGDAAKGAKNPFYKSSYADLNAIREAATPVLNAQGITVLQPMVTEGGRNYVRTLLLHESGEFLSSDTEIVQAKANDPQAHGSGISYARRYGLQSFLNIGAVDDDGESAMDRKTSAANTTATATPAAAPKTATFRKPPVKAAEATTTAKPVATAATGATSASWE